MRTRAARLLVVLAHPDDESLACGGTLALCAERGVDVTLVCVTRGHAGALVPELGHSRDQLPAVREAELRMAAGVLGVRRVIVLDHRDGLFPWKPIAPLDGDLSCLFEDVRPDAVLTFGEDGLYWHPDHVVLARRTWMAAMRAGTRHPCPVYGVSLRKGAMRAIVEAVRRDDESVATTIWGVEPDAFGVKAHTPTLVVDVRGAIGRKLAALHCHRSQLGPQHPLTHLDESTARTHLGEEYFRLWPCCARRTSFFDDLATPDERPGVATISTVR